MRHALAGRAAKHCARRQWRHVEMLGTHVTLSTTCRTRAAHARELVHKHRPGAAPLRRCRRVSVLCSLVAMSPSSWTESFGLDARRLVSELTRAFATDSTSGVGPQMKTQRQFSRRPRDRPSASRCRCAGADPSIPEAGWRVSVLDHLEAGVRRDAVVQLIAVDDLVEGARRIEQSRGHGARRQPAGDGASP